jgi:hypothetical protein
LTQSVSGRVGDGSEDGRVPSGDAGLAKHLSVLLTYIDQRDVQNVFACHLSGSLRYERLNETSLAGLTYETLERANCYTESRDLLGKYAHRPRIRRKRGPEPVRSLPELPDPQAPTLPPDSQP